MANELRSPKGFTERFQRNILIGKGIAIGLSQFAKAADYHLRILKPAVTKEEPKLFEGKIESIILSVLLDMYGVKITKIKNRTAFIRAFAAFNQSWHIYDHLLDEKIMSAGTVTEDQLDATPVFDGHLKREVTGAEGMNEVFRMVNVIYPPEIEPKKKGEEILSFITDLKHRFFKSQNDPKFQGGEVLPFEDALEFKRGVTGLLGEGGAQFCAMLLGIDNQPVVPKLFAQFSILMQFSDDMMDWKIDWLSHLKQKVLLSSTGKTAKPIENLFLATLEEEEFRDEKQTLEKHLNNNSIKSVLLLKKFAPKAFERYVERFEQQIDLLPDHNYKNKIRAIFAFSFWGVFPNMPESGKTFLWANDKTDDK